MKASLLTSFAIVFILLTGTFAIAESDGGIPRQVDPSILQEQNPNPFSFLQFYQGIARLISYGNFTAAISQLNSTGLIHVPSQLQFVYSRFNSLLEQAATDLQQVNSSITSAKEDLASGIIAVANSSVYQGYYQLSLCNVTLNQLMDASVQIESSFAIPSGQLQNQVNQLVQVERNYKAILDSLSSQISILTTNLETGRAFATVLTLNSTSHEAYLGSNITLTGQLLTSREIPISNRTVEISSSFNSLLHAITDSSGRFEITLQIPYVYTSKATFSAHFIPEGDDSQVYLASSSSISIALLFYQPSLRISAPLNAIPGSTITVNGSFSSNLTIHPDISIAAFSSSQVIHVENNTFSTSITIPANLPDGIYSITASSSSDKLLAPASFSTQINVHRLYSNLTVNVPYLLFGGQQISITGKAVASNSSPLSGSTIQVFVSGAQVASKAKVSRDGSFVLILPIPVFTTTGNTEVSISLSPSQSWAEPASIQQRAIAISPVAVIAPILIILLGILFASKERIAIPSLPRPASGKGIKRGKEDGESEEQGRITAKPEANELINSFKIVLEYFSAQGITVRSSETLREYLKRVKERFPQLGEDFELLTGVVEQEVYGQGSSEEDRHAAILTAEKLISSG